MKNKTTQIAFVLVLLGLSLASTFMKGELIANVTFSVVAPSFILSLISFFDEIIERCEYASNELSKSCFELSNKHLELAKQQALNTDGTDPNFSTAFHTILDISQSVHSSGLGYSAATTFFEKFRNILWGFNVLGYVSLFASLILSPYFIDWFSHINLNCLTLWSLTILYFSQEFKSWFAKILVLWITRRIIKKQKSVSTEVEK